MLALLKHALKFDKLFDISAAYKFL